MLTLEKKITIDEYMAMPIGAPYQFINGCLIDWPSRTPTHQITLGNVISCVYSFEEKGEGIFIMGPIEVIYLTIKTLFNTILYTFPKRIKI